MGRFDLEHSPDDDRLIVYVRMDDGTCRRVYIESTGRTSSEPVNGSTYESAPLENVSNSDEVQLGV